jgi:hypothetical protein
MNNDSANIGKQQRRLRNIFILKTNVLHSGIGDYACAHHLLPSCLRHRYLLNSRGQRSGSILSDYGLDDRAIQVRSPIGAENFSSSPCVQTGSGAHSASYPMGTGGSFPGGKVRPGRDADRSPPSSSEVKNE